jgi:peptidoglycan/LPS O-acetylase OafA/YrhL
VRKDIQFLRCFAVSVVLFNHFFEKKLTGGFIGVDIFFVISGFLITGHLLKDVYEYNTIKLKKFWAKRIRRILPASLVCTFITGIIAYKQGPFKFDGLFNNLKASIFYFENILLGIQSTDYFNQDNNQTPVWHFWSLGVEEQFYLIWPVLMILICIIFVKKRKYIKEGIFFIFIIVFFITFIWNIILTNKNDPSVYFWPWTRMWELAAGGILALVYPYINKYLVNVNKNILNFFKIITVLGLIISVFTITGKGFPGFIALIPVFLSILFIVNPISNFIIDFKPFVFIGDISYSLYLWHLPILILVPLQKRYLILLSILIATISYYLIENPIRFHMSLKASVIICVIFSFVSLGTIYYLNTESNANLNKIDKNLKNISTGFSKSYGSPNLFTNNKPWFTKKTTAIYPKLSNNFKEDNLYIPPEYKSVNNECYEPIFNKRFKMCEFSYTKTYKKTIALVGDSNAQMYLSSIMDIAKKYNYRVLTFTKGGNALLTTKTPEYTKYTVDNIKKYKPDLTIIANNYWNHGKSSLNKNAYNSILKVSKILQFKSIPRFKQINIVDCLSKNMSQPQNCKLKVLQKPLEYENSVLNEIEKISSKIKIFDPKKYLQKNNVYYLVIGNVIVYANAYSTNSHLTKQYASSLDKYIFEKIKEIFR